MYVRTSYACAHVHTYVHVRTAACVVRVRSCRMLINKTYVCHEHAFDFRLLIITCVVNLLINTFLLS